ncbi:rRNA maturation RNase YbeY [Kangiella marina]|uniref:Endoribonuclease YbeY n=1 Tax=Kangiella marina TaxID=1079178 RepID=A0ABP8IKJ2_9GAMM
MSIIDLALEVAVANPKIPEQKQFLAWAQVAVSIVLDSEQPASLSIRVVSSEESQQLNFQYRGKDRPTNVLSFPFELPPGLPQDLLPEEQILGDLAICADIVELEAKEQQKQIEHHWAHMVVHGCLHLLGYDHIKDEEAEIMEALEAEVLAGLGIGNPYVIEE